MKKSVIIRLILQEKLKGFKAFQIYEYSNSTELIKDFNFKFGEVNYYYEKKNIINQRRL